MDMSDKTFYQIDKDEWDAYTAAWYEDLFDELVTFGALVPVKVDIDEIVHELADCVLHGSWGTGCDFDYAEARAIILRIGNEIVADIQDVREN